MQLVTKHFGEIIYDEALVIHFDHGLPGFPDLHRFMLVSGDTPNNLFCWLQCLDDAAIAFTLIDVYQLLPSYNPVVEPEAVEALGSLEDGALEIYNIAVIPEELKQMRVNLKAPIVINPVTRKGAQVIVSNEDYNVRHYIFEEVEKMSQDETGR